jgi:transcription antitermination factor NusB
MFRIKYSREIALKILYEIDALKCDAAQAATVVDEFFRAFGSPTSEEEQGIRVLVQEALEKGSPIDDTAAKDRLGSKLGRIAEKILDEIRARNCAADECGPVIDECLGEMRSPNAREERFIRDLVQRVLDQKSDIDAAIAKNLIGWKLNRLALVDRNLLRMGIAESQFQTEKPIIIDDVLLISKKYSDAESYKLINAILDKVIP